MDNLDAASDIGIVIGSRFMATKRAGACAQVGEDRVSADDPETFLFFQCPHDRAQ